MLRDGAEFNRSRGRFELDRNSLRFKIPGIDLKQDSLRPMPIYEYAPTGDAHCDHCKDGFDVMQKMNDPKLTQCPQCDASVERRISAPNLGTAGPAMTESNIEKHGFTQYRKLEKGVYEKTAGKGPDFISDD